MTTPFNDLIKNVANGDIKSLARTLTIVENDLKGADEILQSIIIKGVPVIGITGPPGAGKSTLLNGILSELSTNYKVAVLAVDPTSPFNKGSLLGDRIRMNQHFKNENVFIRSLATRGSLGGLSAKTIEMVDVLKSADFDFVFVETVGVGQSEVEIAGLADVSVVVLVPESGDEIQSLKSGLMEIADIFVVNKSDREGADAFLNQLKKMLHFQTELISVVATTASKNEGIKELLLEINKINSDRRPEKQSYLLVEKAWQLIQNQRMSDLSKKKLQQEIAEASRKSNFNLYRFIEKFNRS